MGKFSLRGTTGALALALVTLASAGCHGLPGFSNSSPGSRDPIINDLTPGASLDGSGGVQSLELPTKKKIEACYATAKQMEKCGKVAEAIYYYEQIRELDPKRELFCSRHLSILYDKKGDFDRALDEYRKLLAANPKDADAYNDLGYGYYTRGQFEAAEQNLRKAIECDPKNKRAWSNYGMALAQLGRYPESLQAFEKAVTKAQGLCNIAFIQAAQGRWVDARDSYALALRHEPGLQKARVALEAMEEGPRSKKDKNRMDARNGYQRDRGREPDPELSQQLLGSNVGLRGADSDIIVIGGEVPISLPTPGGRPLSPSAGPEQSPASAVPQPPIPIAPSPGAPVAD